MIKPPFDLIFITYDEPKAEENWQKLNALVPTAKRVHGVEGIARAWVEAAKKAETSHFFTMDGDSQLAPGFQFDLKDFKGESDQRVHVYRCKNRVNGLIYGYGSVHLFPTKLARDFKNLDAVDFTLSVATEGFCIQPEVASISCFNTSEYIAWKSGFREASKLASKTNAYIGTKPDERSFNRLKVWTSVGRDADFGEWCLLGARMGAVFGFENSNDSEQLALISNHHWFENQFEKVAGSNLQSQLTYYRNKLAKQHLQCEEFTANQSRMIKEIMHNV